MLLSDVVAAHWILKLQRLPGWIPRDHRAAVSLSGSAILLDGRKIAVEVTDLSGEGCRVESQETLKIGERLTLEVETFESVAASVRWSLFGTAGLRFEDQGWK